MEHEDRITVADLPVLAWSNLDWQLSGECANHPEIDFFNNKSIEACRNICNSCPVALDCLEFAIRNNIKDGVWGGLTPKERKGITV